MSHEPLHVIIDHRMVSNIFDSKARDGKFCHLQAPSTLIHVRLAPFSKRSVFKCPYSRKRFQMYAFSMKTLSVVVWMMGENASKSMRFQTKTYQCGREKVKYICVQVLAVLVCYQTFVFFIVCHRNFDWLLLIAVRSHASG